jgi:SAM-dependent methyltransferase
MSTLTRIVRRMVRRTGFDIVRLPESRPVLGSFPGRDEFFVVGNRADFCIHDGYRARTAAAYFNDQANGDLWQREVYTFAREIFNQNCLSTVADVGCGSGYKLVHFFRDCKTIGLDVPDTCAQLRRRYPLRTWVEADFGFNPGITADLVIASDVIEHLVNPDELMSYIAQLRPRFVVLSTPERNLLLAGTHDGPPSNPSHIREWNFVEFKAYVGEWFEVVEHFVSNSGQGTQCILCRPFANGVVDKGSLSRR